MATIHFVKDGKRPNGERVTTSVNVSASLVGQKLGRFDLRYSSTPPTINPEIRTSDWDEYKHVVVEFEPGEIEAPFEKAGYYFVVGLTPSECKRLLGVVAPDV